MESYLQERLPRLLELARTPQPLELFWESTALLALRTLIGSKDHRAIIDYTSAWLGAQPAPVPPLMDLEPAPTRSFQAVLDAWSEEANRQDQPPEPADLCPVCMVAPIAAITRPCRHKFCGECLSLCARARLPEPLRCPVCRTRVEGQNPLGRVEVTPLPDPPAEDPAPELLAEEPPQPDPLPRRRPRVNEQFLSEHELHIYLNFVAPVLSLGPAPPPDVEEDWG